MRTGFSVKAAGLAVAVGALAAIGGCDTNYYGDSGTSRSTTTTSTTTPAPMPPPVASTTTTVTPNPDGSVTTTERNYRRN